MKRILFYLSLSGWIISLIVHLLSIFDIYSGNNPFDVYLVMGIFFVWVPAIFISRQEEENDDKRNTFWDIGKIPRWIKVIAVLSCIYATANFWVSVNGYHVEIYDGQYILREHSTFIKYLTQTEYIHYKANDVRLATGHCLAFYAISLTMLYYKKQQFDAGYS